MAGGPSPTSTSPSNLSNSPLMQGSLSSTSSSPPKQPFSSHKAMAADVFTSAHSLNNMVSPYMETSRMPNLDHLASSLAGLELAKTDTIADPKRPPAILLQRLPGNSNQDSVRSILLFAKDLVDCELLQKDERGHASAIARFRTWEGAKDAQKSLNGKRLAPNDTPLTVNLLPAGYVGAIGSRRNTVDSTSTRQGSVSTASGIAGSAINGRQSSRYNGTFQQNMEKMAPPNGTPGLGNGEFSAQNMFSPTSPMAATFGHRDNGARDIGAVGKDLITGDCNDDDDGLLNETIGLATGASAVQPVQPVQRRPTMPSTKSHASSHFAPLSVNTTPMKGMAPFPMQYPPPQSTAAMQSPRGSVSVMSPQSMSPPMSNHGPNAGYQPHFPLNHRQVYPPANPADQNPPCNTLYVGNLPVDTSEDELKAIFSKQRGYKRLCFRTKAQGPMCFVEFEDIQCSSKALTELYGITLTNSVKGGIRLSFSKNPLGVRNQQNQSAMGIPSAVNPHATMSAYGGGAPFTAAVGPPPGLSAPPGLSLPAHSNGNAGFGMYGNGGFGAGVHNVHSQASSQNQNGFGSGMGPKNIFQNQNGFGAGPNDGRSQSLSQGHNGSGAALNDGRSQSLPHNQNGSSPAPPNTGFGSLNGNYAYTNGR